MRDTKTILILGLFLALPFLAQAQASVYSFWQDDSLLKSQWYAAAMHDKKQLLTAIPKEHREDYKDLYEYRFEQVKDILQSTRVVADRQAHQYLQSILERITYANPELKTLNIRLIFSRDSWPNAYSTGEGTLIINAGLLPFLENEAELVFVICHELSHLYLDHGNKAIQRIVETMNNEDLKKEIKKLSKQEYGVGKQIDNLVKKLALSARKHSRENEKEADLMAFTFMKKTPFDCNGILSSLAILDKVDDSLLFRPLQLETALGFTDYPFRKKWIQKESVLFGQLKEDDSPLTKKEIDSLKTHPDCTQRILFLNDSIKAYPKGQSFVVNEEIFNTIKAASIPEMVEELYREKDLGRNLYYSLQLIQHKKLLPLAIFSVLRGLNQAYESQLNHTFGRMYASESRELPADYNLLLRMLGRLKLDEIASLAYYFSQKYSSEMENYPAYREQMALAQKRMN